MFLRCPDVRLLSTLRNAHRCHANDTLSDHFLHIPQVSNHGSLSLRPLQSGREAGDYDPDPDILTALQPQSHQVILSSSPVFNSSAPALAATTASSPSSTALIPDNLGLKGFCQFLR